MPAIITYSPQAPLNNFQAVHAPRLQAMHLQTPMLDTVSPHIAARAGAQLGAALTRRGQELQDAQNAATALQNLQEVEKEFIIFENEYRQNTKRAAAANAPQDYDAFMQGKKQEYLEKMKDSPAAARLFELQFSRRQMDAVRSAGHYAYSEDEANRSEIAQGEVASLMQRAAQTDDLSQVAALRAETKAKLSTLLPGRDLTANFAKLDGDLAESLINRKIAQEDFSGATSLVQQFRGELGGRYDETLGRVKNSQRSAAAYYEGQREKAQAKQAENISYTLMQNFGGDSSQAYAWIDANAKSSEEKARLSRAYTITRNIEDAKQQQVQQESYIKNKSNIDAAIQSANGNAKSINDTIFNAPQELQQYAVFKGKQALGINGRALSVPHDYAAAQKAIENGEPFESVMVKHEMNLSDIHVSELKNLSENNEKKSASAKASMIFEDAWARSGIGNDRGAKAQLKMEFDVRTKNAKNTDETQREAFILLSQKSVPGGWLGTRKTVTALQALEENIPHKDIEIVVPERAKKIIYDSYLELGIDLTDPEHMDIYFDTGITADSIYQVEYIKNFNKLTRFGK